MNLMGRKAKIIEGQSNEKSNSAECLYSLDI